MITLSDCTRPTLCVDCDVNIENNGLYVMRDQKCYCKIVDGKRAEKYPWEEEGEG